MISKDPKSRLSAAEFMKKYRGEENLQDGLKIPTNMQPIEENGQAAQKTPSKPTKRLQFMLEVP